MKKRIFIITFVIIGIIITILRPTYADNNSNIITKYEGSRVMKIKKLIIMFLCFLWLPIFVGASGGISISKSSGSVYVGDSTSFKITASNCAGKISVTSEDGSVASINKSTEWIENESITVSVKGNKIGSTKIKVHLDDVSTFDNEELTGKTYTYTITVKEKPNYSKNNNLKSISVDGYDLQKKDNNNYYLTVNKNVESINIKASAEDEKAKVSNTGTKKLNIGENKFEVVITSESGSKNIINVIVTRKEGYTINDLNEIIKDKNVEISLDNETIVKKSDFELIKSNKKNVTMSYYDNDKNNIYTWIFDGSKITESLDLNTKISISDDNEEISKLINYSKALFIDFAHSGKVLDGTKIKINVKDNFKDNDSLNLYFFNKEKNIVELIKNNIVVKDNIATLEIDHCSMYFLTKADVYSNKIENDGKVETKSSNTLTIIFGIVAFVELLVIGYLIYMNKIKKGSLVEENNNIVVDTNSEETITPIPETTNNEQSVQTVEATNNENNNVN